MKKVIISLILFLVLLELTSAALINITKTDFTNEPKQAYRLYNGDGISFDINNKNYVISIDDIGKTSVKLKSFVYKNDEREILYLLIDSRFSNKIDFDKDNYYDLKVDLGKIENESVIIIFEKLNESKYGNAQNKENVNKSNYNSITGILIAAIIIVVGLIIYFIFKK